MHLIRLDIDRKNSAAHLQVGPFGGGLNAVFAPIQGGSATMTRFVRSILFRGKYVNEVFETEEGESIDGSMQWVDSTGHVRMMSFAGGSAMLPGGFVNSPLHPSQHTLHTQDKDRIRGLGNIFWEGDDGDARWDELRGDILGMIFCSSLGSVSPEKLWWSASRLGVHSPARNELDEGYQRLKAEEQDLLDRLRNADAVDHDRAWWALERDRILSEISHIAHTNHTPTQPSERANQSIVAGLRERLAMVQIELNNLRNAHQDLIVAEANAKLDIARESSSSDLDAFHNGTLNHVTLGRGLPNRYARSDWSSEIQRTKSRMEKLVAEQADIEIQLQNIQVVPTVATPHRWDDAQLRQQLTHAEEMLKRWDRRTQWHRRLNEVQSHLKTRSPYRRTSEGSLIPLVEKYLRELTAGACRQLPPWAVESSYLRGHDMPIDFDGQPEYGYREHGQRDVYYDRRLPTGDSRQRRLVDLAMRLAIAEAAIPRIGRIPFLFDNSIELFRGEALEQVLHVLAGFARDGRQILLATNDEFVARRIAAHGGTVSRMHELLRYARPGYLMDGTSYLGIHPNIQSQPAIGYVETPYISTESANHGLTDLTDINRQLSGLANEMESSSWWSPLPHTHGMARSNTMRTAPVVPRQHRFQLHLDSPIQDVPTVDATLAERFRMAGVHRVGDLVRSTPDSLGECMRVESDLVHYLQCVAELMTSTPQLRPFDARVLVGCGISRSHMLHDLTPNQLVDRVANYLRSAEGQDLLQTASPFEANRIREWVASVGRNSRNHYRNRTENDRHRSERRSRSEPHIRAYEPRPSDHREREPRVARDLRSTDRNTVAAPSSHPLSAIATNNGASQWKFYLDIDSPVVDAPSIGPKMATKLAEIDIHSIADLINCHPESAADRLAERNVSAETIADWQKQALLVCRVPNLRGHDAQIIVGTGLSTAEELANSTPEAFYEKVMQYASSRAGVRILRGAVPPDRKEVNEWIHWAQNCRAVRAA
ncbi:MAG: DUF4332 domain-containing protein [Pirellula sp.]|jgi:hypothetical protein|nr:DUF4332 domain-containing protein [Pirellula sp.]